MRELGFETLLRDRWLSPIIVTFFCPADTNFVFSKFYDLMKDKGFIIYPGKLTVVDSFRVGCIGQMDEHVMRNVVMAAKETLLEMGVADAKPEPTVWLILLFPHLPIRNNLSIATGRPPAVHGICGNYLYDPETETEVMMNDVRFLRAPTIFHKFQEAGARVAIEHGIDNGSKWTGMEVPEVYSAELSEFVFAAGVKLLAEWKPDVMYLTTTDFIQHKHAPGEPVANSFYENFDKYLGQLDEMGAAIVITGDHGMKPKHHADGSPNVVYVQDLMDEWLGEAKARVILPITDPYVVHHGALGSFATMYLPEDADRQDIIDRLAKIEGIEFVCGREEACGRFGLPADRIGDIVLTSGETVTIGTSEDRHDLAALKEPLRSHGGLHEQTVPFIVNRTLDLDGAPDLRNFDAFFYAA
ncbi:Phosphonoacetate hydrolase [Nymphon striatum]|nr:Phosphonoacetate hydrolase [Nymphon striatum]